LSISDIRELVFPGIIGFLRQNHTICHHTIQFDPWSYKVDVRIIDRTAVDSLAKSGAGVKNRRWIAVPHGTVPTIDSAPRA
jgi:hypothetical protein